MCASMFIFTQCYGCKQNETQCQFLSRELLSFLSPRLIALSRIKNTVDPIICLLLEREQMDSCLSQGYLHQVKHSLKDSMIHDRRISGIWSERTKAKLRNLADPDLNTVIRIRKNDEIIKRRIQHREDLAVNQVRYKVYLHKKNREKNERMWRDKNECGRRGYNHIDKTYTVKGQICRNCQIVGVFFKNVPRKKSPIYK